MARFAAALCLPFAAQLPAAGADGPGTLEISAPWVRAMPPGRPMTAAYATLRNTGDAPLVVSGVSTSLGVAALHESRQVDGQMRMRPRDTIVVPAGGVVRLEPGGLHVMVTQLEATPVEGDSLRLCFLGAGLRACSDAPVARRAPAGGDPSSNTTAKHSMEHR